MNKKLIIFDCDGTLVDTEFLGATAFTRALAKFDIHYDPQDFQNEFIGTNNSETVRILNARHKVDLPFEDLTRVYMEEMFLTIPTSMRVLPESLEYVRGLADRDDIQIVVGSNGNKAVVIDELRHAGYLDAISVDRIAVASDVARPKPHPDLFLHLAATHGVAPEDCVVVEDSPTGARAGLAAGMRVVGYTGLSHMPDAARAALENAGVSRIINQLPMLDAHLT